MLSWDSFHQLTITKLTSLNMHYTWLIVHSQLVWGSLLSGLTMRWEMRVVTNNQPQIGWLCVTTEIFEISKLTMNWVNKTLNAVYAHPNSRIFFFPSIYGPPFPADKPFFSSTRTFLQCLAGRVNCEHADILETKIIHTIWSPDNLSYSI